jgi:hypothetical protein
MADTTRSRLDYDSPDLMTLFERAPRSWTWRE